MKGIVFTQFLEMVDERFGAEACERMIEACAPESGGAYTAVGTYSHGELVKLVMTLSGQTGQSVTGLVQAFGEFLFGRLAGAYPGLLEGMSGSFDVFRNLERMIHPEVRKLYPDAELPRFECREGGVGEMELTYQSKRPFADLAEGLIRGCIAHYGEEIEVARRDSPGEEGRRAVFALRRAAA